MEDILSSIRSGVEDEQAKVGMGSADLIDAAAAQDGEEDDVLELSASDMVGSPASAAQEVEELIDIAAFASSGEAKAVSGQDAAALAADILGEMGMDEAEPVIAAEATPVATEGAAADEFDRLLAEISQEQQQNVAAAEVTKQALMDEEEPLGTEEVAAEPEAGMAEAVETAAVAELGEMAAEHVGSGFTASTVEGPNGMQIAFPAEVLAMALRPMVQDWLAKNLPAVVEKLVKDEISKLTQN